jgi:hypothetical protein
LVNDVEIAVLVDIADVIQGVSAPSTTGAVICGFQ